MKIEVHITKTRFFVLLGVVVFLAGIVFVIGQAGVPNPGHDISQLSGVQAKIANGLTTCSASNLAIKTINPITGTVTCETDTDCNLISASNCFPPIPSAQTGWSPDCPAGWTKQGGVDQMAGTGVGWCRTSFSLCCK